ncbi:hypothetical protein [Roseibium aggregatum]|nr:hypothetical protein [Roseibium aggregatum]
MFGFVNVIGATLRETTLSAEGDAPKAPKTAPALKPVKAGRPVK